MAKVLTPRRTQKTGEYQAKDAQGMVHTIEVYTEFLGIDLLINDGREWVSGMESHRMKATGNHVNVNDDGTLTEVRTGRAMTRI